MKKQRRLLYQFFIVILLFLVGCQNPNPSVAVSSQKLGAFKVAILLPQAINDNGWSQSGYEGLKFIEKELAAQVDYQDNLDQLEPEKIKEIFRNYASKKFDFVIGHGGQFEEALEVVSQEYPRTKFAIIGGYAGNNKNLGSLSFRTGEITYLAGAVAALKTQNKKIGIIEGMPFPNTVEAATLFIRGVNQTNPNIQVMIQWVNSFSDPEKSREIAKNMVDQEIDVIFADAGLGNLEIFKVAQSEKIKAIGFTEDQYHLAPNVILTSCITRVPVVLFEGAMLVRQGRWEGKQYRFGIEEGAQELAPFRGKLTAGEQTQLERIKQDILLGKIDISP